MDYLVSSPIKALATVFAFVLVLYYLSRNKTKKRAPPKAGGAWPLIGHLHLLGGPKPPHIVLGDLADKKGPIFTINMGIHRTLVVNNWKMAKECLTTNDRAFASRPKSLATEILGYDQTMIGFSPYGPYWRQIRKIATLELLSNHRLEMLRYVRESEVKTCLKELYKIWQRNKDSSGKVLVEMRRWSGDITLNVIFGIVVGKSVGYMTTEVGDQGSEAWKEALREFFVLSGRFVAADAIPFLRWFDIGGHGKAMIKTAKALDIVVEEWLKEHKERRASGFEQGKEDFMDLMLNILDGTRVDQGPDSDTINKTTCLALILAASDTTTVTLTWALSLLVNNPEALKKAQNELEIHVGKERQVQESDVRNLVYLQAILKETMRLYPAGPLSLPHESLEDCTVSEYHIPAGTRLLVNLWKIHRDPRVWSNPCEFKPERFLNSHKDFDVRGQSFEYMPFGSGRRMCPGVTFAMQLLLLTLASLLHSFDFATPRGEPLDMTESIGLTNLRATPLDLLINPRLESYLYQ